MSLEGSGEKGVWGLCVSIKESGLGAGFGFLYCLMYKKLL